jgi:hypothetical protein
MSHPYITTGKINFVYYHFYFGRKMCEIEICGYEKLIMLQPTYTFWQEKAERIELLTPIHGRRQGFTVQLPNA